MRLSDKDILSRLLLVCQAENVGYTTLPLRPPLRIFKGFDASSPCNVADSSEGYVRQPAYIMEWMGQIRLISISCSPFPFSAINLVFLTLHSQPQPIGPKLSVLELLP